MLKLREIGVPDPGWMPYRGLLLPLADRAMRWGAGSLQDEGQLATWFWARSFGMDYGVASSTRIAWTRSCCQTRSRTGRLRHSLSTTPPAQRDTSSAVRALGGFHLHARVEAAARPTHWGGHRRPAVNAVVVSLFPRGEGDLHLRVLGMILLTRPSARCCDETVDGSLRTQTQELWRLNCCPSGRCWSQSLIRRVLGSTNEAIAGTN